MANFVDPWEDPTGKVLCCITGGGMPVIEHAIGVIKAIQTKTYAMPFDVMMGTSAGAIVAGMFMSYNQDIVKFENLIKSVQTSAWFKICPWQAIKSVFGLSNYVANNEGLKNFLLDNINDESVRRVRVGVTEMPDNLVGRSLLLDGRAKHVLASMSFQKIFPPCRWGGMLYGDGGVNNLCPLPKYMDMAKYKHVYIILAPSTPLLPSTPNWPFLNELMNLIDSTMNRELEQIKELALDEAPNITVFCPEKWTDTAQFLSWSEGFEQIEASYNYALDVIEEKEKKNDERQNLPS